MIQPAGLGGSPARRPPLTAAANASWTASSAMSMSPKTRTRTATARPYSARKTRSISAAATAGMSGVSARVLLERPHLDRQRVAAGELAAPLERGVEIGRLDDGEAADVLLALGERAVGHEHVAVLRPHHRGGAGRVQAAGEHPGAGGLQLLVERPTFRMTFSSSWGGGSPSVVKT